MKLRKKLLIKLLVIIVTCLACLEGYRLFRAQRHDQLPRACWAGDVQRVARLLRLGADPNGVWDSYYYVNYNWTVHESSLPLHQAAWKGHSDVVRLLLAAGAEPHARDKEGGTALSIAACRNHPETVRILAEAGSPISLRYRTDTALDVARRFGHMEVVRILEEHQHK